MIHNIPDHAKKVFQGTLFSIYQWEQQVFDGSTQTFECAVRPDSVTVIPVVGDKILLTYQKQPHRDWFYALPGGRVDGEEEHLLAAQRECAEETGYTSEDWELLYSKMPQMSVRFLSSCFIARGCKETHAPHLDAGEKIEIRLVSLLELLTLSFQKDFRACDVQPLLQRAYYDEEQRRELERKLFRHS